MHELSLSRDDLRLLLRQWQEGKLSSLKVMVKVEGISERFIDEWPTESEYLNTPKEEHIAIKVVGVLEWMLFDLITEEDIPFFLKFLATPKGREREAMKAWDEYFTQSRYEEREKMLKQDPERAKYYVI